MSFRHGKDSKVLVGAYDISSYLNEFSYSQTLETAETTAYGDNAKKYLTGQNDGTISFSGMFESSTDAVADVFEDIIANDTTAVITLAYDGGLTIGRKAGLAQAKQTSYDITAPVADVVSLSGEFQVTGGIRQGVLLAAATSHTTTTNTASVDGSASSSNGAKANLHVTANTMDAGTVIKVQHSADDSTWADLITFTTVSSGSVTSETSSASGTVNRYLRASTTPAGSGSITYTLSIARRSN